jgi:hypothetical protein
MKPLDPFERGVTLGLFAFGIVVGLSNGFGLLAVPYGLLLTVLGLALRAVILLLIGDV